MFSLRELGPNLSLIDFIKNVNALLVNFFCKVCCVLVVEMFPSFFFFLLSLRVIISTYEPLYNYRNFNFLLLLWTEKIFMAMNKHWQLFSNFPFVFISCKYFVAHVCSLEGLRER